MDIKSILIVDDSATSRMNHQKMFSDDRSIRRRYVPRSGRRTESSVLFCRIIPSILS